MLKIKFACLFRINTVFDKYHERIWEVMMRKVSVLIIIMLFTAGVVYAFGGGNLRGRIIDGFGNPIASANIVSVSNGLKSKATSESTGNFSLGYTSGSIKLTFSKEGYVPVQIPLTLHEEMDLSLDDITLWGVPPKGGLFVVGNNNYTEINKVEYYSESNSKERRFYVKGSPTLIKGQDFRILDFETDNPLVIGKTLYTVDSKGSVGSVIFYPSQKYALNKTGDTYAKIADNLGMRKVNLQPGRYFYCTGEITIRSKVGYGFFFEVTS